MFFQVIQMLRQSPYSQSYNMFHPLLLGNDGNIYLLQAHDAIPLEDVRWLYQFMQDGRPGGVVFDDAIYILRRKQFPLFNNPCSWIQGNCVDFWDAKHRL